VVCGNRDVVIILSRPVVVVVVVVVVVCKEDFGFRNKNEEE